MFNDEFVSLVWILNHPSNAVVASTLYENVMVELENKKCVWFCVSFEFLLFPKSL